MNTLQALNGDHDFGASAVLQAFDKHESRTKDYTTEPNSQKQESKVCLQASKLSMPCYCFCILQDLNASTPKTENKFANTPADNKLPISAGMYMLSKLFSQIIYLAEHKSNVEVPCYPGASFAAVSTITVLMHLMFGTYVCHRVIIKAKHISSFNLQWLTPSKSFGR